jgi:antitoxin component of MazEF toxin-antitoxin module
MKVSQWGNSLRLPAEMVLRLGLKEGDEIAVVDKDGASVRLAWMKRLQT